MNDDDYYEDDRPPRLNLLVIALGCMAAAFGLILYCSIAGMG